MIFCTNCGTPQQEDDNFCLNCGKALPKAFSTGGEKIINIPRSLAKRCLYENLDILRKHQKWCRKTYDVPAVYKYLNWPKHVAWIQFDPTTGRCERILMTRQFDQFDDSIMVDEGLSQIKPGWHYCRIMMPTAEWQIQAYLDSPEEQVELGPTTPSMGGYQARFV